MQIDEIVRDLEAERDRLTQAIAALRSGTKRRGRPPGRRRQLSEEARRRISLGMKRRWAERKKKTA